MVIAARAIALLSFGIFEYARRKADDSAKTSLVADSM